MKILLASLSLCIASNLFSQTINNNPKSTTFALYSDTLEYDLNKFTAEYAVEISTWPQERKEWYNKTFAYTRGNIRIPKEPIVPAKWKE
jgi:hypothetical protein